MQILDYRSAHFLSTFPPMAHQERCHVGDFDRSLDHCGSCCYCCSRSSRYPPKRPILCAILLDIHNFLRLIISQSVSRAIGVGYHQHTRMNASRALKCFTLCSPDSFAPLRLDYLFVSDSCNRNVPFTAADIKILDVSLVFV